MQVCSLLQTDNHASTPPLRFYRPDALPATRPTVSKHWRHWYPLNCKLNQKSLSEENYLNRLKTDKIMVMSLLAPFLANPLHNIIFSIRTGEIGERRGTKSSERERSGERVWQNTVKREWSERSQLERWAGVVGLEIDMSGDRIFRRSHCHAGHTPRTKRNHKFITRNSLDFTIGRFGCIVAMHQQES